MSKKQRFQRVLGVLMMVLLLIGMIPGVASAAASDDPTASQTLQWLNFMSNEDSTLITGETRTINIKLYKDSYTFPYTDPTNSLIDIYPDLFSGSVTASITDSEGKNKKEFLISGSQGNYSISNVLIDIPGKYTLVIRSAAPNTGQAIASIKVVNAVTTVIGGNLAINKNDSLSVKIADSDGNPLIRKSVTVDGSEVGATAQSYTTDYEGKLTFQMTPSLYGNVSIKYAGHIIGSIPVLQAYTQNLRIGGSTEDNVSLAVAIAQSGWTMGTSNVILSRDDQFSDALAAAPLSKKLDAPILMTDSAQLDERTLAEIYTLGAKNVYIVGGTVAISQDIQDSLSNNGFTTTRIAGQQGYDTAALISSNVGIEATQTVYLANAHAIPDAIAISAFAAEQGSPILLTDKDQLPPSTIQALTDLKVNNVILLGGTAVIGASVENDLSSKYSVKRWGGFDRYDTQSIIFQNLFNTQTPQSPLYFTAGEVRQDDVSLGKPYADALLTAALAAKTGGFVAMLPKNNLPSSLNYFLLYNKGYISKSSVVGNYRGVSKDLEQQLQQVLNR